jgi:alkylated DNA repair dioxygenase AlkB
MHQKIKSSSRKKFDERKVPEGLFYRKDFLSYADKQEIFNYLKTLHPIWEQRYSKHNPPPPGKEQRSLLRPVYWLGNWQFACLNYYHPPKGTENRSVFAEDYPPVLRKIVDLAEKKAKEIYPQRDVPSGWELNTCLINYYGKKFENGKWVDGARVGEHKDFEPGPVASLSLGERAMFQFVSSVSRSSPAKVVFQQWLEDGSLQIFGGRRWKEELFHRVQRVDKKMGVELPLEIENFKVRRINFTFRYVPKKDWVKFKDLPVGLKEDVTPYVEELAKYSPFFANLLRSLR